MNQNTIVAIGYGVVVFGAMYFLWIAPQQKQRKAQAAMIAALKPGDEVVTVGGIFGTIVSLDEEDFRLEIAPGVVVRLATGAVAGRRGGETSADA